MSGKDISRHKWAINVSLGRHICDLASVSFVHKLYQKVTYSPHLQFPLDIALMLTLP